MDTNKAYENRTAYDEFLARLDRQMRGLLGTRPPLRHLDGGKSKRSPWPTWSEAKLPGKQ